MSKQAWRSKLILGFSLTLSVACGGSENDGKMTAGGAGQAQGGASAGASQGGAGAASGGTPAVGGASGMSGGGSMPGGSSSGGSSGSTGGGLASTRCRPSPIAPGVGVDCEYQFAGSGISEEGFPTVESQPLEKPLVAGTKAAFSVRHIGDPATIEVWGTPSSCGAGAQKLVSADVTEGPYCFEFTPSESFTELLYVTRSATQNRSVGYFDPQVCVAGTCP